MIVGATLGSLKNMSYLREPLFVMMDTGVKECMEGCQLFYLVLSIFYQLYQAKFYHWVINFLIIHDRGIKVLNKFLP